MRSPRIVAAGVAACLVLASLSAVAAPKLEKAFAFGAYNVTCPTANDPAVNYTIVLHGAQNVATADFLTYDTGRGWGYIAFFPNDTSNNGFGRFAGVAGDGDSIFDKTANNRNLIADVAGQPLTQIYDSFIGPKKFVATCSAATVGDPDTPCAEAGIGPQGIVFRVDVPNGKYRFVAVSGSPDNRHANRILVEDGGEETPLADIGTHVVLISNFDQARACPPGTADGRPYPYARVAFGCYVPPNYPGVTFVNMDENGLQTDGPPVSPTLTVTQNHIRVHQLQGNANDGACGARNADGGDLIILEIWNVGDEVIPPAGVVADVTRTVDPPRVAPGGTATVTLTTAGLTQPITVVDEFPAAFTIANAGGGTVDADNHAITFQITADGSVSYVLQAPATFVDCACAGLFAGTVSAPGGCTTESVAGDKTIECEVSAPECPKPPDAPEYELVAAFAFGTHPELPLGEWCMSYNDDTFAYTPVEQVTGTPASIEYTQDKGFGYEVLYPAYAADATTPYGNRTGWEVYGPIDDSPNDRAVAFGPACAEALYDSFIGAKAFLGTCNETTVGNPDDPCPTPEGIIFRADVPNGEYRFVLASGDSENPHAHRILAEDGGSGPPGNVGTHVVLVAGHDQGQYGIGVLDPARPGENVFARVGFDDKIPPPADGVAPDPVFVNMDENGKATSGCVNSPALTVTSEYVRIHQLQFQQNSGCGGLDTSRVGGDLVVLELWKKKDVVVNDTFVHMGNVNTDTQVNIADAVALLGYLFAKKAEPACAKAADANDDDQINIADAVAILGFLFSQKPMYAPDHSEVKGASTCKGYPTNGNDGKPYFPAEITKMAPCVTQCTP